MSINIWDTSIMNIILINRNNIYSVISHHVQQALFNFHLEYSESFSGALFITINLVLHFNQVFDIANYRTCLLSIEANTVAVFMPFPDVCKIFYSHSLDMQGMEFSFGYSV